MYSPIASSNVARNNVCEKSIARNSKDDGTKLLPPPAPHLNNKNIPSVNYSGSPQVLHTSNTVSEVSVLNSSDGGMFIHEGRTKGQYLVPSSNNSSILNISNICNSSIEIDSMENTFEKECSEGDSSCISTETTGIRPSVIPKRDDRNDKQENKNGDPYSILNKVRLNNIDRPIIAHLNINFLYQKFEALKNLVKNRVDILVISETKLDNSFPIGEFEIEGYSTPIRLDRNCHGGGIILYVRSDLPCKELNLHTLPNNVEGIFAELTIRKTKWLFVACYNNKRENIVNFLSHISIGIDKYLSNYDNFLILGDMNVNMLDINMNNFCETYNLENLINKPTCYKNARNPSSIDVILTNRPIRFANSMVIETGLSDHHKMVLTVLKSYCKKSAPIITSYRNYKHFDENSFRRDLIYNLENFDKSIMKYEDFKNIFMDALDVHAPLKKKTVRGNNAPFMNKALSKAFMRRSRLKNNFNKNPSEANLNLYKKQRNFCVSLLKKVKRKYYNNLDVRIFDDNITFWKRIKPLFSDKQSALTKDIVLVEDNIITANNKEVAEKLNNFFVEAVANLEIQPYMPDNWNYTQCDSINDIIAKYESHPSIKKIKENVNNEFKFSFANISSCEIQDEILKLNSKKASVENDIPAKILIGSCGITSPFLSEIYNKSKNHADFPMALKLADVIPVHKKDEKNIMKNYRPISLLPIISKLYEKIMYNEINSYVEKILSSYLFGFRKGHSTEQCLIKMLETWRKAIDDKKYAGAILTDLSKAFDCLNHNLLIAKLHAYGFDDSSLNFIRSYLKERKQRIKVGQSYSTWNELQWGVPQGSILGPLLFNIFLSDIFYFIENSKIANYADDNTAYSISDTLEGLLTNLEGETSILLKWFQDNEMKPNEDKCHLFVVNTEDVTVTLGDEILSGCSTIDLLGITIDNRLNFSEHVTKLCKKGNQKLHALARVSKYLSSDKLKLLMKSFITSQFNYCPLAWMFHNRTLNNKINKLHERALRLVYKNDNCIFQELLEMDNAVTIHDRNLQRLATEMFKVKNEISPLPIQELFEEHKNYVWEQC